MGWPRGVQPWLVAAVDSGLYWILVSRSSTQGSQLAYDVLSKLRDSDLGLLLKRLNQINLDFNPVGVAASSL